MLTIVLILLSLSLSFLLFFFRKPRIAGIIALAGSLAITGVSTGVLLQFIYTCHCNLEFAADLCPSLGITLNFGVDRVNIWLVMMTGFLFPLAIFAEWKEKPFRSGSAMGWLFLVLAGLMVFFTTRDAFVYTVSWGAVLLSFWMAYRTRINGTDRRLVWMFFTAFLMSALLLAGTMIFIYLHLPVPRSFDFMVMYDVSLDPMEGKILFWTLFLASAAMVPLFPLHLWQQRLLFKASPSIGILLSALIFTMGLYGVIRLVVPFGFMTLMSIREFLLYAVLAGGVWFLVLSLRSNDVRRLITSLSMSFLSFITAGLLVPSAMVLEGALYLIALNGLCLSLGWLFLVRDPRKHNEKPANKLTCYLILPALILLPAALSVPGLLRLFKGMFAFHMAGGFAAIALVVAIASFLSWKMISFITIMRSKEENHSRKQPNQSG